MAAERRYSAMDRLLHLFAFGTHKVQAELSALETRMFRDDLDGIEADRPVFISGLPRSGTTLLLDICYKSGAFASHCYRDMPFVQLPLLWNRFASRFGREGKSWKRAHGDGMRINLDSPEAFEEAVWMTAWPGHYRPNSIAPWHVSEHPEFLKSYIDHLRKIIYLRQISPETSLRYISKNNANIARIEWLSTFIPSAVIIIPFRDPVQQARSALKVHLKFMEMHREDHFSARYMAGIGHFDFGVNLRPIDFGSWIDSAHCPDPSTLGFWLEYWTHAYSSLLKQLNGRVHFVSYDRLCSDPEAGLRRLGEILEIKWPQELLNGGHEIIKPKAYCDSIEQVDSEVMAAARSVHKRLQAFADV